MAPGVVKIAVESHEESILVSRQKTVGNAEEWRPPSCFVVGQVTWAALWGSFLDL